MNRRSIVGVIALGSALAVEIGSAEVVVIPLDGLEGYYGLYTTRTVQIDAGCTFHHIDEVRIEWGGEATAGYGWENGPECPGRYVVVPMRFYAYLYDGGYRGHADSPPLGEATYPAPEPFDTSSQFSLSMGGTWDFLLDGNCECRVEFWLAYGFGFCTLDWVYYPWAALDSAQLVIVGQRHGDLNADGAIDLSDLAQLLGHYGTTGGAAYEDGDVHPPTEGDGDVDLADLAELLGVYGTTCN